MSVLDIFAWIVLIVLVCCTVAVVIFMAMLPGMIARSRNHPYAQECRGLGHAILRLRTVAGGGNLGLR